VANSKRISTDGGPGLSQTPFAGLSSDGLPAAPETGLAISMPQAEPARKHRGRVDIMRVKAGRGGKTVTLVKNFVGIGLLEKEQLWQLNLTLAHQR
jgi:translation initiation factor 1